MEKRKKSRTRAGIREDWAPDGGWDDIGADPLDRLRESCRGWAVGSGWDYMASSPLGLNAASANTLSCTAHDIGVYEAAKQAAMTDRTPKRRDTRDLDAACDRIAGAGGPDFEPEP